VLARALDPFPIPVRTLDAPFVETNPTWLLTPGNKSGFNLLK
jgi:hypothetical protein